MKIAVTSYDSGVNGKVDPRFGRASCFMVYNEEEQSWQCSGNQQNLEAAQGAGIQAAQNVRKLGASILITGNVGPKAFKVLDANGIKVFTAEGLTVLEAYQAFSEGKLKALDQANVEGHWS
jgi:predicted Fe-Mo cluster-binding NifX family protein